MPTNFSDSFNPLVPLKTGQTCSLKRHFSGCLRQVVGYLDMLAANDPDRLVFAKAKAIQKHCKNYDVLGKDGKPTTYGLRAVERSLEALRSRGLLSRRHAVELQERRGFIIKHAYVFTPHDAVAIREERACRFVGMGRVPGTKWGAVKGDVWFMGKGQGELRPMIVFEVPENVPGTVPSVPGKTVTKTVAGPVGKTVDATVTLTVGTTVEKSKNNASNDGYGDGAQDRNVAQSTNVKGQASEVCQEFAGTAASPNPVNLLTTQTTTTTQPPKPKQSGVVSCKDLENRSAMEEQDPAAVAQANVIVDKLLVHADKTFNWGITSKQKEQLAQLVNQHGSKLFLGAGREFVNDPPKAINKDTLYPWLQFLTEFAKYAERYKRIEANRTTPKQIADSKERARQIHLKEWNLNEDGTPKGKPNEPEPGAEGFLDIPDEDPLAPVPDTTEADLAAATEAFKTISDANRKSVEERKAQQQADEEMWRKAEESGNW